MEKLTIPPDAEQTQLTEVSHIGGEPAPPPPPATLQTKITPTSVLTENTPVKVADRPTFTDPVLAVTPRSRKLASRSSQRAKQARGNKAVRTRVHGVRKWRGSAEDCRSVDLIDAIAARLKGEGLSQRALNIGVVAFVVVLIFAANWATRRPAPEQTNIVEIAEPAAESAVPAEAQSAHVQQESPEAAGAAPTATESTAEQTPSAAPAEALAAGTPVTEGASVPATEESATSATAEAAATTVPETQPAEEAAAEQPSAPAETAAQAVKASTTEPKEDGGAEGSDSGVEVVKKAVTPKAKVVAKSTPRKPSSAKVANKATPSGKEPEKLPAIIAGEPYTAGGPQDLDSDAARQRYLQETKLSAKRGAPAGKMANNRAGKQKGAGTQPTPPKQGSEKTFDEIENSYEQPLPTSK